MNFSLIIPCYNEGENLPFLFQKLDNILNNKNIEVIIVENGSTDNSLAKIKKFKKKILI